LHAGPGLDGSIFFPWLTPLADRFTLIAPDMRGHGLSTGGDPAGWSIQRLAADVTALTVALELDDFALLGHSFGAVVALGHAIYESRPSSRLVLSCGVAHDGVYDQLEDSISTFEPAALRERIAAAFEAESHVFTLGDCHAVWSAQLPFFLGDPGGPLRAELGERWREVRYSTEAIKHPDWGAFDVRSRLGELARPVLVIAGEHDRITPPWAARELATPIPDARLEVIAGAGHFPFAERPEEYVRLVDGWLAGS